jgi:transcription elongation factor Elf1
MKRSSKKGYGTPYRCPACEEKNFYGLLKKDHERAPNCANCGVKMVPSRVLPPAHHLVDPAKQKQGH